MKELTPRLAAVAALVRPGSRLADIGTDHAYLPVWLVAQGICPFAIASDIGEGPANSARRTISEAELSHLIPVRVGDGLASIQPGEVEDIAIAGMGGETIAAILEAAPWVASERYHLVLQPMSKPERLRRFLLERGFGIEKETVLAEGERLYCVMSVTFTGEMKTP
ncbi:MAG: SAM-dependent methyltransferase, partial [Clostridia bacterium]|nr:SAM-dependent methyltransferase [Clostridia bacterium]